MRDYVPEFVDLIEQFKTIDENAIQAYALKVNDKVLVKQGKFDPVKNFRVTPTYRRWS